MEQPLDFDTLYASRLLPVLGRLQKECSRADKWGIAGLLAFVLALIIGFLGLQMNAIPWYGIYFTALMSVGIVSLYNYGNSSDHFIEDFKKYVINEIVNNQCPGAVYKPDECISQHDYKISGLYHRYYDYYSGNDHIEATVNGASFRYSELWTQYDDGRHQINIFRGLFFAIKINDASAAGTYIWPVEAEQLPASIYDEEYRLMPLPHIYDVPTGDKQFDDYFRVCSTDPAEAAAILTPVVRHKLVALRKESGTLTSFSFVAGNFYVAIPFGGDLLEPSAYDPADKEEIRKYYLSIQLITGIVAELPLNLLV